MKNYAALVRKKKNFFQKHYKILQTITSSVYLQISANLKLEIHARAKLMTKII